MPKLPGSNPLLIEIGLEQIIETGNVRHEYTTTEINELADSIYKNTLINPITVKKAEIDENGVQLYELIAGHRRIRAIKKLVADGLDYSRVKATIVTGDKDVLQLVENIQRQDLTAEDKEAALLKLIRSGMSQKDISIELAKPLSWVNDTLAGSRVRAELSSQGIETEKISTPALSQLRSIPKDKLPEVIQEVKDNGSTVKAATQALNKFRNKEKPKVEPVSIEPEFAAEPVTITLENIVEEIVEYRNRTVDMFKKDSVHTGIIKTVCDDLIALFRRYEA